MPREQNIDNTRDGGKETRVCCSVRERLYRFVGIDNAETSNRKLAQVNALQLPGRNISVLFVSRPDVLQATR